MSKKNTNRRAFAWAKRLRDSKLRDSTGRTREIQAEIFHLSHLIECHSVKFPKLESFWPAPNPPSKTFPKLLLREVTPTNAFTLQNLWNLKTSSPPETGFPRHPRKIPIDLRFSPRCCQVFHKSVKISSQKLKRAADSLREKNVVDMENVFHLGILPNIYRVFFSRPGDRRISEASRVCHSPWPRRVNHQGIDLSVLVTWIYVCTWQVFVVTRTQRWSDLQLGDKKVTNWITWYMHIHVIYICIYGYSLVT